MAKNGEDKPKDDSRWRCPYCKNSGVCDKGQEKVALGLHLLACEVWWEMQEAKKRKNGKGK